MNANEEKLQRAKDNLVITLLHYIGRSQRAAIASILRGEERYGMADIINGIAERVVNMPVTYQTDGQGKKAIVQLHYFGGAANFYITEKDMNFHEGEYDQSFGYANLFGGMSDAEAGYISIKELVDNGLELDLHWTPVAAMDVKS